MIYLVYPSFKFPSAVRRPAVAIVMLAVIRSQDYLANSSCAGTCRRDLAQGMRRCQIEVGLELSSDRRDSQIAQEW